MKTTNAKNWTEVCAAVLTAVAACRATADEAAAAPKPQKPDKQFTGRVVSVSPQERTLNAKGIFFTKRFNLGVACTYMMLDNKSGALADLRPGEKVTVSYQNANGVLIADGVVQEPMRYEGMVQAIDPVAHTLALHTSGMTRTFQIAPDCGVALRDDKPGTLADIQTGNHVMVTYETPDNKLMARQIAQTSIEFTGTLTAIDLGERTLKARSLFGSRQFNVANHCAIVINGKPDGRLSDLKPEDRLVFSYDEINGVNVVNRIAPVEAKPGPVAANSGTAAGN